MREVREVTSSASFTRAPLSRRNWGRGGGGGGGGGKIGENRKREREREREIVFMPFTHPQFY